LAKRLEVAAAVVVCVTLCITRADIRTRGLVNRTSTKRSTNASSSLELVELVAEKRRAEELFRILYLSLFFSFSEDIAEATAKAAAEATAEAAAKTAKLLRRGEVPIGETTGWWSGKTLRGSTDVHAANGSTKNASRNTVGLKGAKSGTAAISGKARAALVNLAVDRGHVGLLGESFLELGDVSVDLSVVGNTGGTAGTNQATSALASSGVEIGSILANNGPVDVDGQSHPGASANRFCVTRSSLGEAAEKARSAWKVLAARDASGLNVV
jgi:hypothetical protein